MAKILIIDDEQAILRMYGEALTNYEVISAQNGEEGLQKAIKELPDIILIDIIKQEIKGLDFLYKL